MTEILGQISMILTPLLLAIICYLLRSLVFQFSIKLEKTMEKLEKIEQNYVTNQECQTHRAYIFPRQGQG